MKVDKAVCTSNDAYFVGNTAANELNSIIKFETVFTTLVENKILAIKRECEEHENKKKSRTFKGILSKKPAESIKKNENEAKKKSHKNFFLRHKGKQLNEVDVEKGEEVVATQVIELAKVEVQNEVQGLEGESANLDSQPNDIVNLPVTNFTEEISNNNDPIICDNSVDNSHTEKAQLSLSTSKSSNINSNKTIKEPSPPPQTAPQNDESLATTIDISLQQQSSVKEQIKAQPTNSNNNKSDLAICDDVSSQNTSDIEFSLVSESISELPVNVRSKKSTNSDPILKKPAHFLSPPLTRDAKIAERKSISCQSTPLFGRHSNKNEGEVKKVLTFQKELPKKVSESTKAIEKAKSQTIVIAPNSTTTTTTLAKTTSSPAESVHLGSRKSQKHSKCRDVSVEYEISYEDDDRNQSPRGFISSFNQLTSQIPPAAVITTTNPKKQSTKQTKVQSIKEGKNQQETGISVSKTDDKTAKHHEIELELDELAIDVVNKKKRRRSK